MNMVITYTEEKKMAEIPVLKLKVSIVNSAICQQHQVQVSVAYNADSIKVWVINSVTTVISSVSLLLTLHCQYQKC